MVLAISQTEFSDREMNDTVLIHWYSVPQHEDIEQCHGIGQACAQSTPCALTGLLQMTDGRQQRQDRLHHHAYVPRPPLTRFLIRRIARRTVKGAYLLKK